MYLIKSLNEQYRDDAVRKGHVRIGTINYYRKIEDAARQDADEGLGHIVFMGQELSSEEHNRIFSPFDHHLLNDGWTLRTKGVPLHGSYPNFNAYTFCYSEVADVSEIAGTAGGKAGSWYCIADLGSFVAAVSGGLLPVVTRAIEMHEPANSTQILKTLKIHDVTYRVRYSDESKARIVTDDNKGTFNPKMFYPQDYFQKGTEFSHEHELRTVWVFTITHESGRLEPLQIPHPDVEYEDLVLGNLPLTTSLVESQYEVGDSPARPADE